MILKLLVIIFVIKLCAQSKLFNLIREKYGHESLQLVENQFKPQVPYETPEINLVKLSTHTIATIQGPYTELAV